jgi:uncharacterized protein (TIGR00730 family)
MFNIKNLFKKKERKSGEPLTIKELDRLIEERMNITDNEFIHGYDLIKKYPRSVSILGSARFKPDNPYYQRAESLGRKIAKELDYVIVTGGGPGIMEAASKGAFEAGGKTVGFAIKLPKEQTVNKYLTEYVEFEYFFSRKTLLYFSAESYVYFPGGFGTFDELFEIITLIQTKKIPVVPVILVGKSFWQPLLDLIHQKLLDAAHTISPDDEKIFQIVDDEDEIIKIIKNAPFRQE